jgi:Arc/MetJ-type ribon-helix-helix transcriptional regulator
MKKAIPKLEKKRRPGRPATGRDPVLTLRMPTKVAAEVEEWAKQQPDQPSRSEAIRRMVEMVLKMRERRK